MNEIDELYSNIHVLLTNDTFYNTKYAHIIIKAIANFRDFTIKIILDQ